MPYRITYAHAFNTTTEQWLDSLEAAQAKAVKCVTSGAADYVEIHTVEGKFVDGYPATMPNLLAD